VAAGHPRVAVLLGYRGARLITPCRRRLE
jgi:hypothetical protein